ncbi:MAG TPA: gliding motility-associated C-terminal domain-containing protein, partial [Saprospiraceae bacterium]|nr:gliding motility-associated C-terminal domain-containing protein [Saprospiraceae bacterium]
DSAEVNLVVVATPAVSIVSVQCAADLQTWEAVIQSTSPTINLSEGALTPLGNNKYQIKNITLNTALQVTASSGNGLCTKNLTVNAPDCACTLSISNLPDDVTLCPDDKITLDAQVSNGKGNVTSFWIVNNDSLYQKSLQVSQAGSYPFVSIDSLGCRDEHIVTVSYYTEMVPDASAQDVLCPGDQDGIIFLNAIIGGTGPFFISVNNGAQKPILAFPYMVTGLAPGNYQVELTDAFGCSIKFNMVIQSASSETLTLGPDISVLVGDSAVIHPVISFVPGSFTWTGDISLLDPNQLDNVIYPQQDLVIQLTATDAKGCVYSDELKIRALLHSTVYVPNVFSPNDDDINDYVVPIGDPSITLFRDFEIFDRWGEKMFEAHDFTPGSIKGWDGRFNGKWMLPGVFAYRVVAINKRDKIIMKWGDVT